MNMMPYLFVARTEPVRTAKFSSDNASDNFVARVVAPCAFTPLGLQTQIQTMDALGISDSN